MIATTCSSCKTNQERTSCRSKDSKFTTNNNTAISITTRAQSTKDSLFTSGTDRHDRMYTTSTLWKKKEKKSTVKFNRASQKWKKTNYRLHVSKKHENDRNKIWRDAQHHLQASALLDYYPQTKQTRGVVHSETTMKACSATTLQAITR